MALNKRQQNLLEYMIANPNKPETVCCRECGVATSTYYDWKNRGEFPAELSRRLKEKWKDSERLATEQMIKLCEKGDYKATAYILDNLGYKPTEKLEANVNATTEIVINIDE